MGREDRGTGRAAVTRLRPLRRPAASLIPSTAAVARAVVFTAALVITTALAAFPAAADGLLRAAVTVSPAAAAAVARPAELAPALRRLFDTQLGSLVTLDTSGTPAAPSVPSARISVDRSAGQLVVTTDFSASGHFAGGSVRSLVSRVADGSPASLLATMCGDLAFLFFSARGFSTLALAPPPALVGTLSTDTLSVLAGWNAQELEPLGLTGHGDEITVCFPHRYLTLGPRFDVTEDTVRDIDAQAAAREPLQLSGVVAGVGGRLVLLSQGSGALVTVDPRRGTRTVTAAPGLSALPARLLDARRVVSLPAASGAPGLVVYSLDGSRGPEVLPVSASYLSALDRDREGNLWTWDAIERRIRILTAAGREVYSIRPLMSAAVMPLPQALQVLDDGSFFLAGSSEVWKFQSSGIPVWRLARIPGRPGESLPSSFDLAADRARGSFTILDPQSRRLLAFSPAPTPEQMPLAAVLSTLDSRKPGDLSRASSQARAEGLGLMAYGFASAGASLGRERGAARLALLEEKAIGYSGLGASREQELLMEQADGAYRRAAEALRELAAEDPANAEAASRLQAVLAARRGIRAELSSPSDLAVEHAVIVESRSGGCGVSAALTLRVRNTGSQTVDAVRLRAGVPSLGLAPALAVAGSLLPSEERSVELPLGDLGDAADGAVAPGTQVYVRVTYERAGQGAAFSLSRDAAVESPPPAAPALAMACRAVARDTLAASLPDILLVGRRPAVVSPLADLAGTLDCLGAARAFAAPSGSHPDAQPFVLPPMRASLRALSSDETEWTVVTASAAAALGFPSAVLWRAGRPFALVDTTVPLAAAFDAVPGLRAYQRPLMALSSDGMLWLPLSGRLPPPSAGPAAWAVADGLAGAASGGEAGERIDLASAAAGANAPIPFPLVVPGLAARQSEADLAAAVGAALVGLPAPAGGTAK